MRSTLPLVVVALVAPAAARAQSLDTFVPPVVFQRTLLDPSDPNNDDQVVSTSVDAASGNVYFAIETFLNLDFPASTSTAASDTTVDLVRMTNAASMTGPLQVASSADLNNQNSNVTPDERAAHIPAISAGTANLYVTIKENAGATSTSGTTRAAMNQEVVVPRTFTAIGRSWSTARRTASRSAGSATPPSAALPGIWCPSGPRWTSRDPAVSAREHRRGGPFSDRPAPHGYSSGSQVTRISEP